MTTNRHKYFRWTRRTALINVMYVMVVPATLGYFGYITDVSEMEILGLGTD
jgi:ABC-type dipeptide/oligopeptide/nickel transport system permease subunit